MKYGFRKGRFHKGNASRLGKLGAEAKARKRMESPRDSEPRRVPDGFHLGCLTWLDSSGSAHRWHITQGPRANNIRVIAKGRAIVCGWDRLLRVLRRNLSVQKRIFEPVT